LITLMWRTGVFQHYSLAAGPMFRGLDLWVLG
jgi:hypothetical protein